MNLKREWGRKEFSFLKKGTEGLYLFFSLLLVLIGVYSLVRQSVWAGCLLIPVALILLWLFGRIRRLTNEQILRYWWEGIWLISFGCMLVLVFFLEVDLSWDWGRLLDTAFKYIDTGIVDRPDYYAMYPNNCFWVVCLTGLFRAVRFVYPQASFGDLKISSMIFSVLLVQAALFFLYRTACLLWGSRKGFLCGCVGVACAPLYVYAMFAYTDTSGIFIVSLFLYCCAKCHKSDFRWYFPVIIGLLAAAVLEIKTMAFIVCIAVLVTGFLYYHSWKRYIIIVVISSFICMLTCFVLGQWVDVMLPATEEMSEQYRFPPTHWIMMGMAGEGGFNQADVDYTISFPGYEEKKTATKEELQRRWQALQGFGWMNHMIKKLERMWGDGTLASNSYCNRIPFHSEKLPFQFFSESGRYHWVMLAYTGIYHGMLLLGLFLSGIRWWRRETAAAAMGHIGILGIIFFFLLWECNSRYLVVFYPLLILTAADGWSAVCAKLPIRGSSVDFLTFSQK